MDPEAKRRLMARFRQRDTKPELSVRRLLHRMGYRFRVHVGTLPGRPDIVLPKYRTIIFVHGCFWHRHNGCKVATMPKSNEEFWKAKFERNVIRDRQNVDALRSMGFRVLTVWECEVKDSERLGNYLRGTLAPAL